MSWRLRGCFIRIAGFINPCFPHKEVAHVAKRQVEVENIRRGPFDVRGKAIPGTGPAGPLLVDVAAGSCGARAMLKRAKGGRMVLRLIKAGLLAGVVALVVQSLPDVRRYLKMRRM